MKRLTTTFALAILLVNSTACITQPTCSGEEMIAMKDKGFDQNRIEAMCISRQPDIKGITELLSSSIKAYEAVKQAQREAKTAAAK
jgi:hypothetical protein